MSSVSKGTAYEKYIKRICNSINTYNCFRLIELSQKKDVIGKSGVTHNIDVFWNFEFKNKSYLVIFECKDYKRRISKEKVAALDSISKDIPNSIPIIVSTKGFQSGAEAYAKAMNITPFICRELNQNDWEGRIKTIIVTLCYLDVSNPKVNFKIKKDDGWAQERNYTNFNISNYKEAILYDETTGLRLSVNEFCLKWVNEQKDKWILTEQNSFNEIFSFENAYIISDVDQSNFKIIQFSISVCFDIIEEEIRVDGDEFIQGIIFDLINDKRAIIMTDGCIKMLDE